MSSDHFTTASHTAPPFSKSNMVKYSLKDFTTQIGSTSETSDCFNIFNIRLMLKSNEVRSASSALTAFLVVYLATSSHKLLSRVHWALLA